MTASEFEILRADVLGLRADVDRHFAEIDRQFAHVEAKLDAKPTIATLYQAVATLAFGIGVVVTSTVVVLKNIGMMG